MAHRSEGFYPVELIHGEWTIWYWVPSFGWWPCSPGGAQVYFSDAFLKKIGERIDPSPQPAAES